MRIESREDLLEVLSKPQVRGAFVGILPDGPPDSVLWVEPLTVGEALAHYNEAILLKRGDFKHEDGIRAILAASLKVDPAHFTLGEELVDPETLQQVFTIADLEAIGDLFAGPEGYSPAGALGFALLQATGWVDPDQPQEPPRSLDAYRVHLTEGRARWLSGIFPQDPEAALQVRPYTEGQRYIAQGKVTTAAGTVNELAILPALLPFVVTSPEGLTLTEDDVKRLPYGGAQALLALSTALTFDGRVGTATFRPVEGPAPEPAGP